jgi:ketosteroid isomerase-like protein
MASANLELVRSVCSAWGRGDYSSTEWADPDIEFVFADGPAPGSWTGLAGMEEGWRAWLSAWEDFRQEVEEYRELDGERVLVLFRFSGSGKTSGLKLEQMGAKAAGLFHVRGSKVNRFVGYLDREPALADLGLEPEGHAPQS